ncbi:MAG: hypothetical protein FJW30_09220 [Acidobacteria bacterium]|nr:hypothetical protein [Acidobacteriota bacterium]
MADPFIGTWELDPAALNYASGQPGKRATYIIEALPAGGLRFILNGEDAEGRPVKFQYGGPLDGSSQALPGGVALILRRVDARSIESILQRDGKVLDRWMREFSADGQSIKMTQFVKDADGRDARNLSVYRRVQR